jgi:hypothetical protein
MGRRIHHDEKMIPQDVPYVIPNECEESKIPRSARDKDLSVATLLRNDTGWLASSK